MFGIMYMTANALGNSPQSFDVQAVTQSHSVVMSAENPASESSPQSIVELRNGHVAGLQKLACQSGSKNCIIWNSDSCVKYGQVIPCAALEQTGLPNSCWTPWLILKLTNVHGILNAVMQLTDKDVFTLCWIHNEAPYNSIVMHTHPWSCIKR